MICEHGRRRYLCIECGGSGICEHGKHMYFCKKCGGQKVICEHGHWRSLCTGLDSCGKGKLTGRSVEEIHAFVGYLAAVAPELVRDWDASRIRELMITRIRVATTEKTVTGWISPDAELILPGEDDEQERRIAFFYDGCRWHAEKYDADVFKSQVLCSLGYEVVRIRDGLPPIEVEEGTVWNLEVDATRGRKALLRQVLDAFCGNGAQQQADPCTERPNFEQLCLLARNLIALFVGDPAQNPITLYLKRKNTSHDPAEPDLPPAQPAPSSSDAALLSASTLRKRKGKSTDPSAPLLLDAQVVQRRSLASVVLGVQEREPGPVDHSGSEDDDAEVEIVD
ncbi:hypothetical protein DFJ74DRAFT_684720 [Hyaloraphidium curvatum]|nr:hypothetical protein DFJ74DRAFT_684720 [Hyaloraphidium curvatum]